MSFGLQGSVENFLWGVDWSGLGGGEYNAQAAGGSYSVQNMLNFMDCCFMFGILDGERTTRGVVDVEKRWLTDQLIFKYVFMC